MKRKNKRNQRLCKALEDEIVKVFSAILQEMDLGTPQKGIDLTDNQTKVSQSICINGVKLSI